MKTTKYICYSVDKGNHDVFVDFFIHDPNTFYRDNVLLSRVILEMILIADPELVSEIESFITSGSHDLKKHWIGNSGRIYYFRIKECPK